VQILEQKICLILDNILYLGNKGIGGNCNYWSFIVNKSRKKGINSTVSGTQKLSLNCYCHFFNGESLLGYFDFGAINNQLFTAIIM